MAPGGHGFSPSDHTGHQETKPSGLISFLHRRQPQSGRPVPLPTPPLPAGQLLDDAMATAKFAKNDPGALGELQKNQQEPAPRSPCKARGEARDETAKYTWGHVTLKPAKSRETSPAKPKKTKSGTNLVGLLSRPKSLKNLYKLAAEDEARASKDKENRTPDEPAPPPPIFAQFTSDPAARRQLETCSVDAAARPAARERPKSVQAPRAQADPKLPAAAASRQGSSTQKPTLARQRGKVLSALGGLTQARSKPTPPGSPAAEFPEQMLSPEDMDKQLEDLLDRRNIPENQRYKMRNLSDTIKMEFIRQDWAEMQAAKTDRSGTASSAGSGSTDQASAVTPAGSDCDDDKPKRSRGRSFTFSRGKKESRSPSKKPKGEGTLGRHFRSKSSESVATDRPWSSASSSGSNLLSKIKLQQGPGDYVAYLAKVQKPQLVEVGKLHKLRLLLRNETVAWIEDFIQQGGMEQIVGLLNRIMQVEWREEHEDALLHENLLCLKALSTTARAIEYLHSVQADLFARLLHMLFDPDKKGPSEFTTRNIVTSVLLTYIESAPPPERVARAASVLAHLRDKEPREEERPLPFVLEMRQERPYRVWCKEVVSVTKEVFWIFLHNLNVVALPPDKDTGGRPAEGPGPGPAYAYMLRHFPPERPPVPAAPYVGGVEWDATNYLASHLDLVNAIVACTPTAGERNALRAELRVSGWECCLGGSLRLCKEKFYGSVHMALRTWVAAAAEDGWDVKDVRFGPSPEKRSSPRKPVVKPAADEAPRLDMPRLDFASEQPAAAKDAWL